MEQMFDPLYVQGYTAAMLDIQRAFRDVEDWLKHDHKHLSARYVHRLMRFLLLHRVILRENPDVYLAWRSDQRFVIFDRRKKQVLAVEEAPSK